jgi:hypothetical protein
VTEETSREASFLMDRDLPESTITPPSPETDVFVSTVSPEISREASLDTETDVVPDFTTSLSLVASDLSTVRAVALVVSVEFRVMLPTELAFVRTRELSFTVTLPEPDRVEMVFACPSRLRVPLILAEVTSREASSLIFRILPESTTIPPSPETDVFVSEVSPTISREAPLDTVTDVDLEFVVSLSVVEREDPTVRDVIVVSAVDPSVMLPTELVSVSRRELSVTVTSPEPERIAMELV